MVKSFVQWLGMYDWDCNTLLLSISNNEFFYANYSQGLCLVEEVHK